jgi:hypothetical protein
VKAHERGGPRAPAGSPRRHDAARSGASRADGGDEVHSTASTPLLLRRREVLAALGATLGAAVLPALPGCGDRGTAPSFLTAGEQAILASLVDRVLPPNDEPGARALGAADYVDRLLSAFDGAGEPSIYAGGPFSGRNPYPDDADGTASSRFPRDDFARFLPLSRLQEIRWRAELFGTAAVPGADVNDAILGPRRGLRDIYREGLARTDEVSIAEAGAPFADLPTEEQDRIFEILERTFLPEPRHAGTFLDLLIGHTLEACFAPPAYGGNRDAAGWAMIGLEGDVQPLGFSIYSRAIDGYVERPDHPMSTPNPDEIGPDGQLRPRPLSAEGERIQANILTLANLTSTD